MKSLPGMEGAFPPTPQKCPSRNLGDCLGQDCFLKASSFLLPQLRHPPFWSHRPTTTLSLDSLQDRMKKQWQKVPIWGSHSLWHVDFWPSCGQRLPFPSLQGKATVFTLGLVASLPHFLC